ncbi:MAG: M48 family metallopeptidase, partial [bacterium]
MQIFQSQFFWIFLTFYIVHEVVQFTLDLLNYYHVKKQQHVPPSFKDHILQDQFLKSQQYTLAKLDLSILGRLIMIPFFWVLVFLNGFNLIDSFTAQIAGWHSLSHSVLFVFVVAFYFFIVSLPLKLYSVFVLEEKYGFNKMTAKLFVIDLLKTTGLSLVLGMPLLYLVFWFMRTAGTYWWLWVWCAIMSFQLVLIAVYPTLLAPLFNKFEPLEEGTLKDKIFSLAKSIRFKLSGVFIVDGSKRSSHSNAYFAGLGKYRRIVLFDTIMKQLTTDELLSVLAHEMGHNVKKHIPKMIVLSASTMLIGFYVMSLLIGWDGFYQAFNINVSSHHAALMIFAIAFEVFTFMFAPIINSISRAHEFQADAFAVKMMHNKAAMSQALLKISKENLSNLTP